VATVSGLCIYPIKSCGSMEQTSAVLTRDGLARDRHWMVVDREGRFLTQRQFPRMALIEPQLGDDALRVSAPGMADLEVGLGCPGASVPATVWNDKCAAFDVGEAAADWFSQVIGRPCRLVEFDQRSARFSDREYAGDTAATTQFSDGFALLVIGEASLGALNERLLEKGAQAVQMARFRPNLTLHGIEAFDEDHIHELRSPNGVALRLVKPCARCQITTVDPVTGVRDEDAEPLATLNSFRSTREAGTIFGQNAIVLGGAGQRLAVGDELQVVWNF
jgi:uncharacterized protein YcbX